MAGVTAQPLDGEAPDKTTPAPAHTRTYQACIPCRRRKVRCDLGPVDNPHDPPCVRCRREAKECFFSATRRKKRFQDSGVEEDEIDQDDLEIRAGRKRLRGDSTSTGYNIASGASPGYSTQPLTPGGSMGRPQPLRRPTSAPAPKEEDEEVLNVTTALLQNSEIQNGHDALNVLLEAATHHRIGSGSSARPSGLGVDGYATSLPTATSPVTNQPYVVDPRISGDHEGLYRQTSIDPAMMQEPTSNAAASDLQQALKAWSRFRFVRAGWFTAREGMVYVDYFYQYLLPLTPVALPDYRPLSKHATLLTDEPMLTVTILLIASRYMKLSGAGALTRPQTIHNRLWTHLQAMTDRVVWGQELFGSGSSAGNGQQGCDVSPFSRKGLRTIGSVESMMLLTEWHPRAMHFPPEQDDVELMVPEEINEPIDLDDGNPRKGIGGYTMDSWLEPAWRSDRICWMLLGMAMSLAFEIGVFDENTSRHLAADTLEMSAEDKAAFEQRRRNVKNLLLVYITQTSGRLGLTSMLPKDYAEPSQSDVYNLSPGSARNLHELVIHFWLRVASLMKLGNQEMFVNREFTRELIKSGQYKELLKAVQGPLLAWRKDFEECRNIPNHMRHILIIEYNYTRVYLNSLALQAVVERCANNTPSQTRAQPVGTSNSRAVPDKAIRPSMLDQWYGSDRYYVDEIKAASRELLNSVVTGLVPGDYLKHAPVRTYFRILNVAIILLKTFALGATEKDLETSLSLLDRTAVALRTCVVDDVHLPLRFADMLMTITNRVRANIVRMSKNSNSRGPSRRVSNSPPPDHLQQQQHAQQVCGDQQQANPGAPSASGQWSYNNAPTASGSPFVAGAGRTTPSHPLYGISNQAYDFSDNGNAFSVMPPPTNFTETLEATAFGNAEGYHGGYNGSIDGDMPDWLALPLDPLLNSYVGDVTQTGYGPGVGDYDMLEILLGGNGNGAGYANGHGVGNGMGHGTG